MGDTLPVADQPPPNFPIRLKDEEKEVWKAAAEAEGEKKLGTWVKKIVRAHIAKKNRGKKTP